MLICDFAVHTLYKGPFPVLYIIDVYAPAIWIHSPNLIHRGDGRAHHVRGDDLLNASAVRGKVPGFDFAPK